MRSHHTTLQTVGAKTCFQQSNNELKHNYRRGLNIMDYILRYRCSDIHVNLTSNTLLMEAVLINTILYI